MKPLHVAFAMGVPALLAVAVAGFPQDEPLPAAKTALVSLLSVGFALWLMNGLLRSALSELGSAAHKASEGDYSVRNTLVGEDQVGRLAQTLNLAADVWSARIQKLQDETNRLTAVLDGMSEGVWMTDSEGRVVRHNVTLKELLFSAGQDLIGRLPLEILRSPELS